MTILDWRWKIGETTERLRTRYGLLGRKTGAPFLALVYPHEAETAVLNEWHAQSDALRPDIDVRTINVLEVTQRVLSEIGTAHVVAALVDPMPGSDAQSELGHLWVHAVTGAVRSRLAEPGNGKPVVSLEQVAALYPAATPRDVMQTLWDSAQSTLECPVVIFIPGILKASRTYSFLGQNSNFRLGFC